jgi:NAD(P)H-hydrate epimerase
MSAVTSSQMRLLEEAAMAGGWTEERLMETAGEHLAHAITHIFPSTGTIIAYLGKGHNAGDALVALRFLRDRFHWDIAIRKALPVETWAPLTQEKFLAVGKVQEFPALPPWRTLRSPIILLDGLLGIGAKGSLREPLLSLAREMAWLRNETGAKVAAIDVPSGTDPDTGEVYPHSVVADVTFMIGAAKRGLLTEQAANATGALAIVPVESLAATAPSDFNLISPQTLRTGSQPRPFDFHKGSAGRVGILAGSPAYTGAAVLAATGALRGGAGLITIHTPAEAAEIIASKCPPEIIIRACSDPRELLDLNYDSLVIGCGLQGTVPSFHDQVLELIAQTERPTVIDAEALNLLATHGSLDLLRENHLLTPHPGEFQRLAPDLENLAREAAAREFTNRTKATLLLKGCRTIITRKGEPLWMNSTGSPGMATGGQGDLLSGVIGSLLARGHSPLEAASLGAWVCGRAAERALQHSHLSEESLAPSDVLGHLGGAFRDWAKQSR